MSDQNYIREQREAERIRSVNADKGSWLTPFAAGIGTIALGAVLLKSRIANNGKLLSNIFNFLGLPRGVGLATDVAANTGKSSINSGTTGVRSLFNATFNFKTNKIQLGPIDIIDDLRTSIELIGNPTTKKEIADSISERTIEYTNRALANYGNNAGYFTQGLERVTIGNILDEQSKANWSNVLGTNQVGILEKARSLGLIKDSMILDKKLYFNPATQEVLDFRLRNLISTVKAVKAGNETVFQRVARFDMFGQGQVVASVLGASNRKIAVLGPDDGYGGSRLFFDGNVYGYQKVATGYQEALLGTNRVIRKSGDPLEVIAAARQGRIETNLPERTGFFGGILSWMENTLGIGPGYANRPSFANRLLIDPYRRFQAIRSGEGTIFTHPFRREFQLNKVMDAALGGDLPELTRAGGAAVAVPGGGFSTELANLAGRTRVLVPNRVGIMFDIVDNMSVIKEQAYRDYRRSARQTLTGDDLIVGPRKGGFQISGKNIPANSMVNQITDIERAQLTAVGFKSKTNQYGYYDVQGSRVGGKVSGLLAGLQDFASYSVYRLNSLFSESLLGVGIRPDHRLLPNLMRAAAVPFAYETGRQVGLYADYLTEKVTGISPIKAAGSIYAGARVAQQKLRELTGIRAAADFLDTYFPGSINSDGATIARSIGAPIAVANQFLKRGNMIGALVGAAATYVGIGGVDPNQTTSELIREYSGDKKVPVRKGRLWGLGYTPFFGGKAERYDYSWYAKLQSDYRTKSIYGSESEYWSYHANVFGVPLPTPSNLFGINNLLNPYRLESSNYNSRPYPQTESDLSKFPIFGPLLNATVGQLIKPVTYRTPTELPLLKAGLAEKGMTAKSAALLGMTNLEATSYEAEDPTSAINTLMRQANIASEPLGIYKFVMEFFGVSVRPKIGTEYATSSTIQDPGRAFYDMSIGGMFGQTEAIRRFLINDYSSSYRRSAMINPIRNDMPTWLPGTYSENKTDRSYFLDLTIGDPFSKLQDGESRLPGAGYEALNELHSGQSGVYDDVDKFLILSDVAPYSAAYRKYEKSVFNMPLENEWATKVQEAISNRAEVIGVDTRYKRYQEDIVAMNMNTIAKAAYAPVRKLYDFVTHDILAEIPYVGSKFFPFRNPEEQYRKTYVEGAEYASWDRPWEDIIRPSLYDIALEDPATAAGKGAMLGFLISGPMRWFTPIRSLVGNAGAGMVNYGTVGLGAAFGAGLSVTRIASGADQNFIPFHIKEEDEAIQYMDAISYIKGSMVEQAGGGSMLKNKTFMGAKNVIGYRSALPRSADKKYFDYFMGIEDPDQRSQISRGLPDFMSVGLYKAWNQDFNTSEEADAQALEFINTNQIPDNNWLGWSPEVSAAATKLRFIQHGINGVSDNIHRFGFYESHEVDLQTRLRNFHNQEINYVQSPIYGSFDTFLNQQIAGVSGGKMSVKRYSTPTGSRRDITIKAERAREDQELLRRISK